MKFELEDAIPLPDQPIHLMAEIRNHTAATITGEQATLSVDGDSRPVLLPDLPSGASTNVPLTLTLDAPGRTPLSFSLGKDALPQDDVRYLNVEVRPTVSVLLIDGAPSAQKFESETDFLALAYSVGARPWNVERISQFDPRRLVPGAADVPDVLVLADVPSLTAEQASAVERLVQRGMGLMIFSGESGRRGPLQPAALSRWPRIAARQARPADRNADHGHRRREGSPVAAGAAWPSSCRQRWPGFMSGNTRRSSLASPPPEGVSVLARWNNSENPPAVMKKVFGKGCVLLFT